MYNNRFDLLSKAVYIHNRKFPWARELYYDSILTLNGGWEHPGDEKTELRHFAMSFDKLIDNMTKNGFDEKYPCEVCPNMTLANGAHRFAIAKCLGIKPVVTEKQNNLPGYDYQFFMNRHKHERTGPKSNSIPKSMQKWTLERSALEGVYINQFVHVFTLFPIRNQEKDDEVLDFLKKFGYVFYSHELNLNENGLLNLVEELYYQEEWKGYTRQDKAEDCGKEGTVKFIYFIPHNINLDLVKVKKACRDLYSNRHSVHCTDTHEEAVRCARAVLVNGDLLDYIKPLSERTQKLVDIYAPMSAGRAISGSFTLELFGLRQAKDLDVIHPRGIPEFPKHVPIGTHHFEEKYYPAIFIEIMSDPRMHFWYHGMMVVHPNVIIEMKKTRGAPKDKKDVEMLEELLK